VLPTELIEISERKERDWEEEEEGRRKKKKKKKKKKVEEEEERRRRRRRRSWEVRTTGLVCYL